MNFHKKIITISLLFVLYSIGMFGQDIVFEEVKSFHRDSTSLASRNVNWGYLTVPENWENPTENKVKIAVAILKSTGTNKNAEAIVFVQGGPGAGGVGNIWNWTNHPLRKTNDIILFDMRGTGYSEPRLCPELGQKFFNILAKNQTEEEDETQKAAAAMACKRELISKGIDVDTYHSLSVAKDLHALKEKLGHTTWNIYGVSYGTFMAQVYASTFPEDIKSLILDSSVEDINTYYTKNTSNYIGSLSKVFELCENDPECNGEYPNLEDLYYETIAALEKNPIEVDVEEKLITTGKFTYNAEDFKVAIQQALYHKQLVEVIPLLITQFNNRNEKALGNLVAAFSSLLNMDYGVYYCVSCNETLPNNSFEAYKTNASQYKKLDGGISFYKSDFKVCDEWNAKKNDSLVMKYDLTNLAEQSFPVIIFAGEYDPITPEENGAALAKKFKTAYSIDATTYGHVPSFTKIGDKITTAFITNPTQKPDTNAYTTAKKINLVKNITLNGGVSKMGTSINQFNPFFLFPLIVALGVMLAFIFAHLIKIIKKKYTIVSDKIMRSLGVLTSFVGILCFIGLIIALGNVADQNYYILAFGLPNAYSIIFTGLLIFGILLVITIVYFIVRLKKITDRSIMFTIIFSNALLATYLVYWGVLAF
ncbi:alpha/beta fold hydrolase [Kordia sp.]|uniref:alpha/beta fold hydrolase n=1 Tax=Kordia sp. TaxID=1965332 RepID=UPI003D29612D